MTDVVGPVPGVTPHAGADTPAQPEELKTRDYLAMVKSWVRVDDTGDVLVAYAPDATVDWVSPNVIDVFGYLPTELKGSVFPASANSEPGPFRESIQLAIASNQHTSNVTVSLTDSTGHNRWAQTNTRLMWNELGSLDCFITSFRDVTGEVDMRQELATRQRLLEAIEDSSLDPRVLLQLRKAQGEHTDGSQAGELVVLEANSAAREYEGKTGAQLIGATLTQTRLAANVPEIEQMCAEAISTSTPLVSDGFCVEHPESGPAWYDLRGTLVGRDLSLVWRDVTARQLEIQALRRSEQSYRILAANSTGAVVATDSEGRVVWASQTIKDVLGTNPEHIVGRRRAQGVHPDSIEEMVAIQDRMRKSGRGEGRVRLRTGDGGWKWVHLTSQPLPDGSGGFLTAFRDIDSEVAAQAARDAAEYDELTGLPTIGKTRRDIESALRARDHSGLDVALLSVSIDSLGRVNDALGHLAGDEVVRVLAGRIVGLVGDNAPVGRNPGGDFSVLLPELTNPESVSVIAENIRVAAARPIEVKQHQLQVTVSIGVAIAAPECEPDTLLRRAGVAMHRSKHNGRDQFTYFDRQLEQVAREQLREEAEVRTAVTNHEFAAWFMPIVSLDTSKTVGYEALARWVRASGVVTPPDEFIPVLERIGLAAALDLEILRQSLELLSGIDSKLTVAVNCSGASLDTPSFLDDVEQRIRDAGVDPTRINLEVTETAILAADGPWLGGVKRLADLGVGIHLDDFGTGYSSINHLRDLPISGVKLDLSFTRALDGGDQKVIGLIRGLAGLANGLSLATIAEGVETLEQAEAVRKLGWHSGQGWLFGKPAPVVDLHEPTTAT